MFIGGGSKKKQTNPQPFIHILEILIYTNTAHGFWEAINNTHLPLLIFAPPFFYVNKSFDEKILQI